MQRSKKKMEPPQEFPFPFPPYPIQANFMKNLYMCLENGNLGIFESPTGTGKTLSVICGAVKWLLDHEERQKKDLVDRKTELEQKIKEIEVKYKNDWFSVQTEKISLNEEKQVIQKKLDALLKKEEKQLKYKERVKQHDKKSGKAKQYSNSKWKNKKSDETNEAINKDDNDIVTKDSFLDEDLILKDIDYRSDSSEDDEQDEDEPAPNCKIFFCSRTHSQLSQFIGELKKSPYGDKISVVPLASR